MRWPWTKHIETRAGYTDIALERLIGEASGDTTELAAAQTACVEACVSLYARSFAVAEVEPALPVLDAGTRAAIVRRLLLRGNSVYAIDVDDRGMLTLAPSSSYDLAGGPDPESWRYRLELAGPSRNETRRLAGASVLHFRINPDSETPWAGCSPLEAAGISAKMLARLEYRMSQESNSRTGYLLEIPTGMSSGVDPSDVNSPVYKLKTDLSNMKGGGGLVETTQSGMGAGRDMGPRGSSWQPHRFGASIPPGNVEALRNVAQGIFGAFGVPPGLFLRSDGTAMREAYRQLLLAGIAPVAEIIAAELSHKLERDFRFSFGRLAAADVAGRARAFGVLVNNGIETDEAKELAGLNQ